MSRSGMRDLGRLSAVALLAGALVAGCGSGGEEAQEPGGVTTLSLWHFYGPPESATGGALVRFLQRYEQAHPGVKVEPRHIPFGDFNRTILQSAAGGELPDIALIGATSTQAMAEAGIIEDLSDRVAKWGKQDAYLPSIWQTTQVGGKTYALPHVADTYAVYYNTELLDEAGVKPPKTWDEMAETARKLTSGDRQGLAVSGVEGEEGATALVIRILAAGGDVTKIDSPAANKALTQFKQLVDSGAMSKGIIGWNEEDVKNQFANGRAAMMINSATYVSTLRKENPDLKWKIALLPGDTRQVTFLAAENLAITSGSSHPDAAWDLMTWMQDPKALAEYLPDRNKLATRDDVPADGDEARSVFAEQLKSAWAPSGALAEHSSEVFTHVQGALQAAISGSATVDQALAEAQQKIDKTLAE
ncbi:extracellular solute-binding protein [Nonomuraea phyllanthi]|uniref:Extracellular solute-binding protein n=1 Tax=Nonomuraea phyllanthi TaxID=2219224 RepID=A0A5C4WEJ5_9ACTN|nr:sugar ABC transporter substrate-binding protein [Nonomuraea phyllanthi]KAB8193161.1 extracellular solute-binding protein [Nonomuraea phyllanthi]